MSQMKDIEVRETADTITAQMDTNHGSITIELFHKQVPKTVQNFIDLAEGTETGSPYYDGLVFHRIIKEFMIQGGCPDGTGTGGPGYRFADEFSRDLGHTGPGILSMANSGANTNGSQFFITLVPCGWLDGRHSVFGEVKEGLDVVKAMGEVATGAQDRPNDSVILEKVTIHRV